MHLDISLLTSNPVQVFVLVGQSVQDYQLLRLVPGSIRIGGLNQDCEQALLSKGVSFVVRAIHFGQIGFTIL